VGPVLTGAPTPEHVPPEGSGAAGDDWSALTARAVSKRFAGRAVLRGFDLDLARGEIRGLLGHNGSGKSTFVKILSGYHRPEPGATLRVCGQPVSFTRSAHDPARRLMRFVHQDLGLVDSATVVENFGVGRYLTGFGRAISWRRERARLAAALTRFGVDLPPQRTVADIGPTDRALLAIARAFDQFADQRQGVLVLDEPTAFLPKDGIERVRDAIRTVARAGVGVLLVTHSIPEALSLTDRVTVLRDGLRVLQESTAALTAKRLVAAMVGEAPDHRMAASRPPSHRSEIVLSVRDLCGKAVRGVSFDVRAGEIVGLTGLLGGGFEQIPYLLFGAAPVRSGSATLRGDPLSLAGMNPAGAIRAGLCLVPGDRPRQGAVLNASAAENITVGDLRRHVRRGRLRQHRVLRHATALMRRIGVRPVEPGQQLRTFSGGNQQKAVLAKWLDRAPVVLLLDEPVHGVDVGSRAQIFTHLRALAAAGAAVVLASNDHDDLVASCDTVLVLTRGHLVARLSGADLTAQRVLDACYLPSATPPATPGAEAG
jgi:ribose transport system ATP-binding protein